MKAFNASISEKKRLRPKPNARSHRVRCTAHGPQAPAIRADDKDVGIVFKVRVGRFACFAAVIEPPADDSLRRLRRGVPMCVGCSLGGASHRCITASSRRRNTHVMMRVHATGRGICTCRRDERGDYEESAASCRAANAICTRRCVSSSVRSVVVRCCVSSMLVRAAGGGGVGIYRAGHTLDNTQVECASFGHGEGAKFSRQERACYSARTGVAPRGACPISR